MEPPYFWTRSPHADHSTSPSVSWCRDGSASTTLGCHGRRRGGGSVTVIKTSPQTYNEGTPRDNGTPILTNVATKIRSASDPLTTSVTDKAREIRSADEGTRPLADLISLPASVIAGFTGLMTDLISLTFSPTVGVTASLGARFIFIIYIYFKFSPRNVFLDLRPPVLTFIMLI